MNLSIDQCGRHGYYAISINDEDCGTRLTPSKCCGSWQTVKTWAMTADQLRRMAKELTAAADSISTPPAQQPGEVGDGRLAEAIWLLHEVCKGLHGVGCGPCIGSHAPMENLHGLIARYLGRKPDKHCRHCDGSGTADMGGECPCVTYALAPKEKGNG